MSKGPTAWTIEEYAALQMALAQGDRDAVLAAHGLDEASYEAIDQTMQAAISAALDTIDEGVPPLLTAYDAALRKARSVDVAPITLEAFARATLALETLGDPQKALDRAGLSVDAFLRGSQYWTPRLAADAELSAKFQKLMGR